VGAVTGGWPFAQGIIYQLMKPRWATVLNWLGGIWVLILSLIVLMSPIRLDSVDLVQLSGKVLEWDFIRKLIPLLNIYSFLFLVGGACYSAYRYYHSPSFKNRFIGNLLVAVGGVLPGIGGSFSRLGHNEVLYITEFIAIIIIYSGYSRIQKDRIRNLVNSVR
jgi:hypothetical protein